MTITFQVESWQQYLDDPAREGLWQQHYAEFEPIHHNELPFGPDIAGYGALAAAGVLSCVVGRRGGVMIGYCLLVIRRHMHYSALCAFEDTYYLAKAERRGLAGLRLLEAALAECKRRGTRKEYWQTKDFLDMTALLIRLGGHREGSVIVTTGVG